MMSDVRAQLRSSVAAPQRPDGDTWYLDEVFVKIQGRLQYLWRAVDEDGDVIDILVQSRRNRRAVTCREYKILADIADAQAIFAARQRFANEWDAAHPR